MCMRGDDLTSGSIEQNKVADEIARAMWAEGVRYAFGIPGNDVLELIRACETQGIRFVTAKSEPSAAFMADGVAQTSGRPAACVFAMGPGLANGLSGIANALMDRTPIVVLGGDIAAAGRGVYTHQVFSHIQVAAPLVKWAQCLNGMRAGQQTRKALQIAKAHPQGPVFLNCPADTTREPSRERAWPESAVDVNYGGLSAQEGEAATARLRASERPLALIGRGALHSGVEEPLKEFLEAWQIPFLATYKAKGVVSEKHELCLGALGLSPVIDEINLKTVRRSDGLVLIGFDPIELRDAWLDAWSDDQVAMSIDWTVQTHHVFPLGSHRLTGDLSVILKTLNASAEEKKDAPSCWETEELVEHRVRVARIVAPRSPYRAASPAALFATVSESITDEHYVTVDVGAHRILACHAIACLTPGQLLQSNGFCCMGYAIPGAIGTALATGKRTIALVGDGCALMSLGDLALLRELDLPVTVVVLNDASLALIELKQKKMDMTTGAVRFRSPDFATLGQGFHVPAERVASNAGFAEAFNRAVSSEGPNLIEAICDPSEYLEQM